MIGKLKCWLRRMRGGTHIWKVVKIRNVLTITKCLDCGKSFGKGKG
jgi:hypothetical protein